MITIDDKQPIFIMDVDGVLTTGNFLYNSTKKFAKIWGCDDYDMLGHLKEHIPFCFVTADKKGFPITSRRLEKDCGYNVTLVSGMPVERWDWINTKYPQDLYFRIFMGDGVNDFLCVMNADYAITTCDAFDHVKNHANYITKRSGGNRAVAEAVLHLMKQFEIKWILDEYQQRHEEVLFNCFTSR